MPENPPNPSRINGSESERQLLELAPLAPEAALVKLGVTDRGLEPSEVEERRIRLGRNEAVHERRLGFVGEIFDRLKNPLVLQLLIITIVSYLMGNLQATVVVGGMIVLSVSLSYIQERRSSWLPYSPAASNLNLVVPPAVYWAWIAGTLVAYVALAHLTKTWFLRKHGAD